MGLVIGIDRAHEIKNYLSYGFDREEVLSWFDESVSSSNRGSVLLPPNRPDCSDYFKSSFSESHCKDAKRLTDFSLKELEMASKKDLKKKIEKLSSGDLQAESILHGILEDFVGPGIKDFFDFLEEMGYTGKYLTWFYETKAKNNSLTFTKLIDEQRKAKRFSDEFKRIFPKLSALEGKESLSDDDIDMLERLGIDSLFTGRLRQLEEEHGITQKEFYEAIGGKQSTVTDWFNGTNPRKLFHIVKAIRWLRVRLNNPEIDLEWLIGCTSDINKTVSAVMDAKDKEKIKKLEFDNAMLKVQNKDQQDLIEQLRGK